MCLNFLIVKTVSQTRHLKLVVDAFQLLPRKYLHNSCLRMIFVSEDMFEMVSNGEYFLHHRSAPGRKWKSGCPSKWSDQQEREHSPNWECKTLNRVTLNLCVCRNLYIYTYVFLCRSQMLTDSSNKRKLKPTGSWKHPEGFSPSKIPTSGRRMF